MFIIRHRFYSFIVHSSFNDIMIYNELYVFATKLLEQLSKLVINKNDQTYYSNTES